MVTIRKYLLILIAISASYFTNAQASEVEYSKLPLKIEIGNHVVGFPFENSFTAFNPHISIGTEIGINKNQKHQLFAATNLGYVNNKIIGNSILFDFDLGYRFTMKGGVFVKTSLSLGILNQYHPNDIYQQNIENGDYVKVDDKGTTASLVGLKMGIGYDFSKNTKFPFRVGLTHNFFIQSPYFDVKSFPIMPQSTSNISITYKFKK